MDGLVADWARRSGLRVSRGDLVRKAVERFTAAGIEAAMAPDPAPATKRRRG